MIVHNEISDKDLRVLIRHSFIRFGGNVSLKIYGKLNCTSGKRMRKLNRVFFASIEEAAYYGFRPCGHCMKEEYKNWKNDII